MSEFEEGLEEGFKEQFNLPPETLWVIGRINKEIQERTKYGRRIETVQAAKAHILNWSNGLAAWYPYSWTVKKGSQVDLDANQILVYGNLKRINEIAKWLDPLPLYGASFEARTRGIYDPYTHWRAVSKEDNPSALPIILPLLILIGLPIVQHILGNFRK